MFVLPILICLLFPPAWLIWVVAITFLSDPVEETLHVKHRQFLGPGGPDDPFAGDPFDDE
jgi:hypothetical protein